MFFTLVVLWTIQYCSGNGASSVGSQMARQHAQSHQKTQVHIFHILLQPRLVSCIDLHLQCRQPSGGCIFNLES